MDPGVIHDKLTLIVLAQQSPKAIIRVSYSGNETGLAGTHWYEHAACSLSYLDTAAASNYFEDSTLTYQRETANDRCAECGKPL